MIRAGAGRIAGAPVISVRQGEHHADTAVTWLAEFTANLTTTNTQSDPSITQLANGNILIAWNSDDDTGVGNNRGIDIIGQIFTPLGQRVGVEFQVNSGYFADDETLGGIVVLPTGGFATAFVDHDLTNRTYSIRLTERDAAGNNAVTVSVFDDPASGAPPSGFDPRVAVISDRTAAVIWEQTNATTGGSDILSYFYNFNTNTGDIFAPIFESSLTNSDADIAGLPGGGFVATCTTITAASDYVISYMTSSSTGAFSLEFQIAATVGGTDIDRDASVAALNDGSFVIAWANTDSEDTDVLVQRFGASGTALTGVTVVGAVSATSNDVAPVVVALGDSGFMVLYMSLATNQLRGQRFDSAGDKVGANLLIASGAATEADAQLLGDGRIAITFTRANGEVGMKIIDTRDAPNDRGVYTPGQWQLGTAGDDVFTGAGNAEFIAGGLGNDTITASSSGQTYFGGAGNDILNNGTNLNTAFGGSGTDTVSFVGFNGVLSFDMVGGLTNFGGEQYAEFENVILGNGTNTVSGSFGANTMTGGTGRDTLLGLDGNDRLDGGAGNDMLSGSFGNDRLHGGAGNDTLIGSLGVDTMNGGNGNDIYYYENLGDVIVEAGTRDTADRILAGISGNLGLIDIDVENMTLTGVGNINAVGSTRANEIVGNSGNNALSGGFGNDILKGGDGNDILNGNENDDNLQGGNGNDTLMGAVGNDRLDGGAGNDALSGVAGNDSLLGGTGNDRLDGGAGNDRMNGGTGDDRFVFAGNWGVDVVTDFTLAGTGERIDLITAIGIVDFADLSASHMAQVGGNTVITAGINSLTLAGITMANLTAIDFLF